MKLPRDISGADLVKALCKHYGYQQVHQVGSHIILETEEPAHHRIAIPDHDSLRIGTLNSILRAVAMAKGIEKRDLMSRL
ncbi:MAG: type II toxin-antitoxin system HicA family toxin [Pyrinomonadaceae bacterium]